ncbi:hypothetical protein PV08_08914 [Exophiala spinifera]|uniref:Uncharacterized protein n=1 Tax=Exophiala spinifera TaxID=91928 RepID=A0A0D2B442_9EURO|nr:uncharacterized protein PV08_08914 [Exophiala spinifera]KIW13723.1 hypothetical protein PV08_08914 [Exophiala spinifera]
MPVESVHWIRVVASSPSHAGRRHRRPTSPPSTFDPPASAAVSTVDDDDDAKTSLSRAQARLDKAKRVVEGFQAAFTATVSELDRLNRGLRGAEEEVVRASGERDAKWRAAREIETRQKEREREWERERERERGRERRERAARRQGKGEEDRTGVRRVVRVVIS